MTHIILSNKINMKAIILTDKETARDKINRIVKEKMSHKECMNDDVRKAYKEIIQFNDQVQ